MNITFTNTLDDLLALNWYHYQHNAATRRSRLLYRYGLPAVVGVVFVAVVLGLGASLLALIPGAVLVIGWFAFSPQLFKRSLRRSVLRLCSEGRDKGVVGRHTVTLKPGSVVDRTDSGQTKTAWSDVRRIAATDRHLFIYVSDDAAHIVPRRAFADDSKYREFIDAAMGYLQKAVR